MRLYGLVPYVSLLLALGGCTAPTGSEERFTDSPGGKADGKPDIDLKMPEEPRVLPLGEPTSGQIAYAETAYGFSNVSVEDDGHTINADMHIDRDIPITEVAWFVIPAERMAEVLEQQANGLRVSFDIDQSASDTKLVRGSIHQVVDEEGHRRKLKSKWDLADGDSLWAPLLEAKDHYVYVARGYTLKGVWGRGSISFRVTATLTSASPTQGESAADMGSQAGDGR
jgi:hypothetical protein